MGFINWYEKKVRSAKFTDITLAKIAGFSAALLVAKLWTPLLSLEWYWYLAIMIVFMIKPAIHMLSGGNEDEE